MARLSMSDGAAPRRQTGRSGRRTRLGQGMLVIGLAVVAMVGSWLLAAPRSAGPDEPGHNVRGAALVRGQLDAEYLPGVFQGGYELPAYIGFPDPACYAFQEYVPASCATSLPEPTGTATLGTRAADYPIWGHLLAGVGTLGPASWAPWSARLFDAAVPTVLLCAALRVASRRGALGVGATLVATTPMAWFMYSVVNPSGLVIAGGLGLWVGLEALTATEPRPSESVGTPDASAMSGPTLTLARGLTAASWAAMALPRRDGLVWASLILSLAILIFGIDRTALRSGLGRVAPWVVLASTGVTLAWALTSDTNDAVALLATPFVPAVAVVGRSLWTRTAGSPALRSMAVVAATGIGSVAMFVVMNLRDNGFDRLVLRLVIGYTGDNLRQAIGVLGWLDTPIPTVAVYIELLAIGALVGAALILGDRTIAMGMAAIVVVAVLVSWTLTMLQNDDTGTYWQGRYYLPLLSGVPIVATRLRLDRHASQRLGFGVLVAALAVANLGLAAMMRRFAVGVSGSLLPWEWDTYGAPLPPVVLLALHLASSGVLIVWMRAGVAGEGGEGSDSLVAASGEPGRSDGSVGDA